jgi:predicted DNA-binding transcriptional regulator AlpA
MPRATGMKRPDPPAGCLWESEAARHIGISQTLIKWRRQGKPHPPPVRLGHFLAYRIADLDEWIASRVVHVAQPIVNGPWFVRHAAPAEGLFGTPHRRKA